MDKAAFSVWGRQLSDALMALPDPPTKVRVRIGQGVNVHAYATDRQYVPFVVEPSAGQAHVRTAYRMEVGSREAAWADGLTAAVLDLQAQEGWRAALAWAADQPGISTRGARKVDDVPVTSGDEEVIRLLEPCNAACDFCACIGVMPDYATSMDEIAQRIDEALARGRTRIVYTGGEPTLLKGLPDLVALAKDKGVGWVNLQTNGIRLADAQRVSDLAAAGLDSILMSIHSHRAEVHDAVMKVPGALEAALAGMRHCIAAGIQVNLNCVIHRDNLPHLVDYLRFFHEHFVRDVSTDAGRITFTLSFISPIGWTLEHMDLVPRISVAAPILAEALVEAERLHMDVHIPGLCGLPACTLPGFEAHLDELRSDTPPSIPARTYVAACETCSWRPRCSGYWSVYLDAYGDGELGQDVPRAWARQEAPEGPESPDAPVLVRMRELAAVPMPDQQIADRLNDAGLLAPHDAKWSARTVKACRDQHGIVIIVPEGMMDGPV